MLASEANIRADRDSSNALARQLRTAARIDVIAIDGENNERSVSCKRYAVRPFLDRLKIKNPLRSTCNQNETAEPPFIAKRSDEARVQDRPRSAEQRKLQARLAVEQVWTSWYIEGRRNSISALERARNIQMRRTYLRGVAERAQPEKKHHDNYRAYRNDDADDDHCRNEILAVLRWR